MAHRNVADKNGNTKTIHSDHGDCGHTDGKSGMKGSTHERHTPHGVGSHPNDLKKTPKYHDLTQSDSDGDEGNG